MDRNSWIRGVAAGQFMKQQNLDKSDVLSFFQRQCNNDHCAATCPFAAECKTVLALSEKKMNLCGVLGIATEKVRG